MAFLDLKFYSEALGMQTEVYVIIPQKSAAGQIGVENHAKEEKYKCLYLLHGLSDDHTIWMRRTSIERYATAYGICVVMPCGHRSFYTDMKYGGKYYTYIAKELPRIIREFLNVSEKREDNYIAGLSMGGYGALKIGLREGAHFCAAAGLSAAADIKRIDFKEVTIPIFGEDKQIPEEEDLFCLAKAHNGDVQKPRIYMAVGTEDFLYEDNIRLREQFQGLDYDYTYEEGPGVHCWDFWDEYIQHVLKWMFGRV